MFDINTIWKRWITKALENKSSTLSCRFNTTIARFQSRQKNTRIGHFKTSLSKRILKRSKTFHLDLRCCSSSNNSELKAPCLKEATRSQREKQRLFKRLSQVSGKSFGKLNKSWCRTCKLTLHHAITAFIVTPSLRQRLCSLCFNISQWSSKVPIKSHTRQLEYSALFVFCQTLRATAKNSANTQHLISISIWSIGRFNKPRQETTTWMKVPSKITQY